jgi:hypothetical protein
MKDEDFLEQRQKIMMNAIEEQVQNEVDSEGANDNAPE